RSDLRAILVQASPMATTEQRDLAVKVLECYGYLIQWLEPDVRWEIFSETKRLIVEPASRMEAVRSVLVALLRRDQDNPELLELYDEVLRGNPADQNEFAIVEVALMNIAQLEMLTTHQ